jgi:hypothetical protein
MQKNLKSRARDSVDTRTAVEDDLLKVASLGRQRSEQGRLVNFGRTSKLEAATSKPSMFVRAKFEFLVSKAFRFPFKMKGDNGDGIRHRAPEHELR